MPDDTWILRPQDLVDGFNPDEDVWYFPRVAGTFKERAGFHGCQMPEQLLGRIIRACSKPRDVVVDPFSGSATTLAVAKKLDRQYCGFELSKEYARLGTKRLANICVGDRLDGSDEPRVSAPSTAEASTRRGTQTPRAAKRLKQPNFDSDGGPAEWTSLSGETQGVLEAFASTNRGFSVDRVVADPILNDDFQLSCDKLSLPGTPGDRNRFLFRLRKAGRIKAWGIDTTRRTNLDWDYVYEFLFASEIAWRQIGNKYCGMSLDEIFCDPRVAKQFDEIAAKFAPGFSPLDYRWGALKLRKEGKNMWRRAERSARQLGISDLEKLKLKRREGTLLEELDVNKISASSGVYLLRGTPSGDCIYAGEATNLKKRIFDQFVAEQLYTQYSRTYPNAELILLPTDSIADFRFARQCKLIRWHKPIWNLVDRMLCA
jgi:site-specific DNA-methyltransferase (adenine-specific)